MAMAGSLPRCRWARKPKATGLKFWTVLTVKRSVAVTSPSYRYLAADIATDFGAAPSSYELRVAQVSASFGRGATLVGSVSL